MKNERLLLALLVACFVLFIPMYSYALGDAAVVITSQPVDATGSLNSTVSFSVTAENAVSYEWQYSPNYSTAWYKMSFITGYDTETFSVPITNTERLNNEYRCKITGSDGQETYTNVVAINSNKVAITEQPTSPKGKMGETISFSIAANKAVSYEWQYSPSYSSSWYTMSFITGYNTTNFSVPLTNAERVNNLYRCKVVGNDGTVIYSNIVSVDSGKVVIMKQPVSLSAKSGDTVTFSVEANNAVSYEWQYSPSYTATWYTMSFISGYNTVNFSVPLTNAERINNEYRCKIVGKDGNTTYTDIVKVIDLNQAIITRQPSSPLGKKGDTVSFSIIANNAVSYEWQYSPSYTATWYTMSFISGYNSANFSVPLTNDERVNNEYRCKIIGKNGGVVYSNVVNIDTGKVSIASQPTSAKGKMGETVTFSVTARNVKNYEWQYSPSYTAAWYTMSFVAGYNTATFSVPLTNGERVENEYRCKITGSDGSVIYSDIVRVDTGKLVILSQPNSPIGKLGDTVSFNVVANNVVSYEWQYSPDYTSSWYTMSFVNGYNTSSFSVPLTNAERLNNEYRCKITGSDKSIIYTDIVKVSDGKAVISVQPKSQSGKLNDTVSFSVTAQNVKIYEWQYSPSYTAAWYTMSFITGYNTATFSVPLTNSERVNNEYRCKITGIDGSVIYTDIVTAKDEGIFCVKTQPQGHQYVGPGETALLSVETTSANVKYQWQLEIGPDKYENVAGATSDTLVVEYDDNLAAEELHYRCELTNSKGKVIYTTPAFVYFKDSLATPSNLSWNNGVASWDAVLGAEAYRVTLYEVGKINPIITGLPASTHSIDLTSYLQSGKKYSYKVQAITYSCSLWRLDSKESNKSDEYIFIINDLGDDETEIIQHSDFEVDMDVDIDEVVIDEYIEPETSEVEGDVIDLTELGDEVVDATLDEAEDTVEEVIEAIEVTDE